MEKYILSKFCVSENEYILTFFMGYAIFKSARIRGRIYITNYRIIIIGNIHNNEDSEDIWLFAPGLALLDEIVDGISLARIRKTLKNMNFSSKIPIFGYNFPIWQTENCRYSQKSIKFNVNLPNKKKQKRLSISIVPKDLFYGADGSYITKHDAILMIYETVDKMRRNENKN